MVWRTLPLWLMLVVGMTPLGAQDAKELVERLQNKYSKLSSFSADFEQIFLDRSVELRESGRVLMKKPGKMHWDYREPTPKIFILNGSKSYFYVPQDRQVLVSEVEMDGAQIPLLFLLGKGNIQRDFQVELQEDGKKLEPENVLVNLEPRKIQGEFSQVILEIDPSRYLIRRLVVVEPIGNRHEYIVSNLQENVAIPEEKFRFQAPPGVEVVSP